MKFFLFLILFLTLFLLTACSPGDSCDGVICSLECENGYVPDSCNCECLPPPEDLGLDDVFGEDSDIQPPSI